MKGRNRLIMGSAIGLAAIAVAVDHTRHRLPDVAPAAGAAHQADQQGYYDYGDASPCGMDAPPCGLEQSPCGLDGTPCSL